MRLASVILPLALPGTFTYEIPDEFSTSAQCGMRVLVNFGKRKIYTGIIVGIDELEKADAEYNIKPIYALLDSAPFITEPQLKLWNWMASYYCCTIGEVLAAAIPSILLPTSESKYSVAATPTNDEVLVKNDLAVSDGSVSFKNVSFEYVPNRPALSGIDWEIKSGSTVGIIGGTGSAKTTLVLLISRLLDATTGEVCVGGKNVNEYSLETLRNAVSIVPQKSQLFSGTVEENLRFGNEKATENEIVSACKIADAHDFVCAREGSYKAQTGQGGTNFSGGQRQRLCIARAIASNPKILILDDSLSAVDTNTDFRIRSALKNALPNTTKIVIAQRISSVQDADEILVLDDGKIVGKGVHQNLLETCDVYREVWNSQQENMEEKCRQ